MVSVGGGGGGGILKSNATSADNTLAYPIPPGTYTYSKPKNTNELKRVDDLKATTQVAGGGAILKSNFTSNENPLSFGNPDGRFSWLLV